MSKIESLSPVSPSFTGTPSTAFPNVGLDTPTDGPASGAFSRAGSASEAPTPAVTTSAGESSESGGATNSRSAVNIEAISADIRRRSKEKGRRAEEEDVMVQTAARIASKLAEDHSLALSPDVETPFQDAVDVVKRLLPYHVFQHPAEDLDSVRVPYKGKQKATEEDLLREEIAETKFALDCWKRRRDLENRFRRARISSGKRASPDDQAYILAQAVLEADRSETAQMNAELRSARSELEKIEREKRAAAMPPRPTYFPPQPSANSATYTSQYRPYSYPYAQPYNPQYTFSPYAATGTPTSAYSPAPYSSATRPLTYVPPATVPATLPTTPVTPSTTAPAATAAQAASPAATATAPNTNAIPVQLPASSLPALSALGIVPVPAANAPPPGQPQPAAVLKGTMQNGTVVSLEINVASLQSTQMSGLALILSALTSRGVNVDGSNAGPSSAPSTTTSPSGRNGISGEGSGSTEVSSG